MGQDLDLQAKSTLLTMWKSESYLSSNVFPWRIFIWLLRKIVDLCRPQEWLWKSASVKTLHLRRKSAFVKEAARECSQAVLSGIFPSAWKGSFHRKKTTEEDIWPSEDGHGQWEQAAHSACSVPQLDLLQSGPHSFPLYKPYKHQLQPSSESCALYTALVFYMLTNLSCFPVNMSTVRLYIDKKD